MKLFKISQDINNDYDTFSDAIVCAENEEEARKMHPKGFYNYKYDKDYGTWVKKEHVKVEYIGEAKKGMKRGVVCSSFNAG